MRLSRRRLKESVERLRYNWDPEDYGRAAVRIAGGTLIRSRSSLRTRFSRSALRLRNAMVGGQPISTRLGGVPVRLVPAGAVAADVWLARQYETVELGLVLRAVQPASTFLDLGSNVGVFALTVASSKSDVRVVAVEPASMTFQLLERNVALNAMRNVTAVRTALGNYQGYADLSLNAPGKDGLNTLGTASHPDSEVVGRERVPVTTLDELVRRYGLTNVSAMKVDVEGGELGLFQGGAGLLRAATGPLILYEGFTFCTKGFGYHPVELSWLLESWGYSTFGLDSRSGRLRPRRASKGRYDSMMVAVKPAHPAFEWVADEAGL